MNRAEQSGTKRFCKITCLFCYFLVTFVFSFGLLIILAITPQPYSSQIFIGDVLMNTSSVITVSSSIAVVDLTFDVSINGLYTAETNPPMLFDYLPEIEIITDKYGIQEYNYLGKGEPIYLLVGSKIIYSTYIETDKIYNSSVNVACVFLFDNPTNFANYILFGRKHEVKKTKCFAMNTPSTNWSFDITYESQYYVGVSVKKGITVASNVSIIRSYYDLSQVTLEVICSNSISCTVRTCNSVCNKKAESYIIIETSHSTNMSYTETSAAIQGNGLATFISFLVLYPILTLCFLVCCICLCWPCFSFTRSFKNRNSSVRYAMIENSPESSPCSSSTNVSSVMIRCEGQIEENSLDIFSINKEMWHDSSTTNSDDTLLESCNKCYPYECQCHIMIQQTEQETTATSTAQCYNDARLSEPQNCTDTYGVSPVVSGTHQYFSHLSKANISEPQSTEATSLMESDIELALSSAFLIPLHQNTFELVEAHSIESLTMATEQDHRVESSLENNVDLKEIVHEILPHSNFDDSAHVTTSQQCIELIPIEELLEKARSVFGNLIQLSVDSKGLVYHCDQYGSTLVIPEEAVKQTATVWFGSCFFSDKFKFGNYVPVTPIVWVYISQKLHKCAELYVPHDTVVSSEADLCQFTILTADDNDHSSTFVFYQKLNSIVEAHSGFEQVFKIQCSHFCSNCVAVHKRQYKAISKRYLIARAEKKEKNSNYIIEFIFICQQQGCRKMIEGQCTKEGFTITSYKAVTFTGDGRVSLSFEPDTFNGWKRHYDHLESEYISAESIDYYKIMGCENFGEVTEDELERLDLLEDTLSYPPRFRIQFSREDVFECSSNQEVVITFNQVQPSVSSKILLESNGIVQPLSPPSSCSSASSNTCSIDSFSIENDPDLGDILYIITSENYLSNKWYAFGYYLKLDTGLLNEIETLCTSTIQCTRQTILHWRNKNKTGSGYISWEPLAVALVKVGFPNLAHKIKDHFQAPPESESDACFTTGGYNGVYCSLCDEYHLTFEELKQHIPSTILNSPPIVLDVINMVAKKIEDKYYLFGLAVGLNDGYLRSLMTDYPTCLDRFIAILDRWKNNDPDNFKWSTVIEILQSDVIGAAEVAKDVMKYLTMNTE